MRKLRVALQNWGLIADCSCLLVRDALLDVRCMLKSSAYRITLIGRGMVVIMSFIASMKSVFHSGRNPGKLTYVGLRVIRTANDRFSRKLLRRRYVSYIQARSWSHTFCWWLKEYHVFLSMILNFHDTMYSSWLLHSFFLFPPDHFQFWTLFVKSVALTYFLYNITYLPIISFA